MAKKLSPLLAAVAAAVVLGLPASAQAAPELTIAGKKATAGQTVTFTSTNMTTQSSLGLIKCTSVGVHGVVNENTGKTVRIVDDTVTGGTTASGCTVGGKSVTFSGFTLTVLHAETSGKGTFSLDYTTKIGEVDCTFTITGSTFTYVAGASPAVLTLTNVDPVGSPAACEPGTLNGTFTVTSSAGVVVFH